MARGFNFSTKGLTVKNVAFIGGVMTFAFLAYAFIAPRLVTPTPVPPEAMGNGGPPMQMGPPPMAMGSAGGGMIPAGNIVSGQMARAYPGYGRFRMGRRINVS